MPLDRAGQSPIGGVLCGETEEAAIIFRVADQHHRAVQSLRGGDLQHVAEQLAADGGEPVGSTPEEFRKLIAAEVPRWRKVVENARISVE